MKELLIQGRRTSVARITLPWRLHLLLDVSQSMKEADRIHKARRAIAQFIERIAEERPEHADMMCLSCFSGYANRDHRRFYFKTLGSYVEISDRSARAELLHFLDECRPVPHGTALRDAIMKGSQSLFEFTMQAGSVAVNSVIAITDGEDNGSAHAPGAMGYPNQVLNLGLIGTGEQALFELEALKSFATSTHHLADFDDLYDAMFTTLGVMVEERVAILHREN